MARAARDVGLIVPVPVRQAAPAATDKEFTKLLGEHILNAKGFYDYGLKRGLTTPEDVRFTITKRQEMAKALVDSGLSRRQAAKVLGVDHTTIVRDINGGAKRTINGGFSTNRERLAQSDQNDWRTPLPYLKAARKVMDGIDLDPASSAEANDTVQATKFYTEAENGLELPWKGTVWLNPPYGGQARLFVERAIREYNVGNVTAACILTNSCGTETRWFQALFNFAVCFIAGRIDFGGPSRDVASTSTHGSAITYIGPDEARFDEVFSRFGTVMVKRTR